MHISVCQVNKDWYLSYAGIYKSHSKLNLHHLGSLKRGYIFSLTHFHPNIFFPVFIVWFGLIPTCQYLLQFSVTNILHEYFLIVKKQWAMLPFKFNNCFVISSIMILINIRITEGGGGKTCTIQFLYTDPTSVHLARYVVKYHNLLPSLFLSQPALTLWL